LLWYDAVQIAAIVVLSALTVWLARRSIARGEDIASIKAALHELTSNHMEHLARRVKRLEEHVGIQEGLP